MLMVTAMMILGGTTQLLYPHGTWNLISFILCHRTKMGKKLGAHWIDERGARRIHQGAKGKAGCQVWKMQGFVATRAPSLLQIPGQNGSSSRSPRSWDLEQSHHNFFLLWLLPTTCTELSSGSPTPPSLPHLPNTITTMETTNKWAESTQKLCYLHSRVLGPGNLIRVEVI